MHYRSDSLQVLLRSSVKTRQPLRLAAVPLVLATGLLVAACGSSPSAGPSGSPTKAAQHGAGKGAGKGSGGGAGLAKGVMLTVQSVSGHQLTAATKVGRTKTVLVPSSTAITRNGATVSITAIKSGETIVVKGTRNSAGDIVASSIAVHS